MHRLVQLDGLRAFAVLGVILHHTTRWEFGIPLGPYCVRLFFVLSGFLITGILLKARAQSNDTGFILRAFYARRFLRIFPVYYASLAALLLLGQPDISATFPWHVAYLSNVLCSMPDVEIVSAWGHLWSLSVEEQFYLLWPALILFMPNRAIPYFLVGAVACGPLFRLICGTYWGVAPAVYLTPGCLDSLGLGALLAWYQRSERPLGDIDRLSAWALRSGLLIVGIHLACQYLDISFKLWLLTRDFGAALVACWLVHRASEGFAGAWGRVLSNGFLVYLGTISYGMYLFHNFVPWLAEFAGFAVPMHGIERFLFVGASTIVVAALSWHVFEKPLNALKDNFPYTRLAKTRGVHVSEECRLATTATTAEQ
ncbi:MAG: hypothetical protein DCC68_11175 [Planctomycetota bacterium]|nr:MAG: hypothetical protein DCC68_11175 [Planctomycetota bacterium]